MRKHIPSLTSLRFLAALWVFLYHLHLWHGDFGISPLDKFLHAGPVGMTFFFVLSGYILTLAAQGADPLDDYRGYAVRRFARIYPVYLLVTVAAWLLIGFAGQLGEKPLRSALAIGLADLTLSNAWFPQMLDFGPVRGGTWSLSAEVFFYALFPLILFHARRMADEDLRSAMRWALGLGIFFGLLGKYVQPMDYYYQFAVFYSVPIYRLAEFAVGVFAATLALRDKVAATAGRSLAWQSLGFALFFAIFSKSFPYVVLGCVFAPFLIKLFSYFTFSTDGTATRLCGNPFCVFLGEASFALYLVQLVTIPWFKANAMGLGLRPAIGLCFVVTLVLACLAHLLIERPMRPLVTRWLSAKPAA